MPINLTSVFRDQPPPLDFVWPGFVAQTVGALVGPGGVGKSFWALEMAMSIAGGALGDLIGLRPRKSGPVIYLAGEDPVSVLTHRIHAIGKYFDLEAQEQISKNLFIEPIMGSALNIMAEGLDFVCKLCSAPRLIVLDTLSRIHQLDENSNGDMASLITRLEQLASRSGASVLIIHHVSKTSFRESHTDQYASRGASALIDNARWGGYIAAMTENEASRLAIAGKGGLPIGNAARSRYVRFGENKPNYGAAMSTQSWYERREGGVLIPVVLEEARKDGFKGTPERRREATRAFAG